MNESKKVSIIVPVYNAEKNLHKCLNSIVNQSYSNLEIILINDGSSDNSGAICDEFAENDSRIKVIHQENSGPSSARNNGIEQATGQYIQFVDADDFPTPDMTKQLVNSYNQDIQLVICGYQSINSELESVERFVPHIIGTLEKQDFLNSFGELYKQIIIPSIWNKLYITDLIKLNKIHFHNDLRLGEDLLFNLSYFKTCLKVCIINDILYHYKVENDQSLSQNYKKDYFKNQLLLSQKVKDFLIHENAYNEQNKSNLKVIHANSVINSLDNLFHQNSPLTKKQKIEQISGIVHNEFAYNTSFPRNFQGRIVGYFIKNQLVHSLYLFFKAKNKLRIKMHPVFKLIKTINHKE